MQNSGKSRVWIPMTEADITEAKLLAEARLIDKSRQHNRHRPTSRNLSAQIRGAMGEIGVRRWLESHGFTVHSGFQDDAISNCDIQCDGICIEIMTAQVSHRHVTGFCVPPGKLRAARGRAARGYIFADTDTTFPPRRIQIQAAIKECNVDARPARETRVDPTSPAVTNFVCEPEHLLDPSSIVAELRRTSRYQ